MPTLPTLANDPAKAEQITDWLNRHPTVTLPIDLTDEGIAETARQYHTAMDRDHGVAIALNRKWDREHR
jgi:hypothetical protein